MKPCILIILFIFSLQAFAQDPPLTFRNHGKPVAFGKDTFYSARIHEIIVKPDFTFEFWSRPHVSCITWHQYKGTWKKENDTLLFSHNYEIVKKPEKEIVYRTIKGVIKNNMLVIGSATKSKTTLPDYSPDIEFEDNYVLMND